MPLLEPARHLLLRLCRVALCLGTLGGLAGASAGEQPAAEEAPAVVEEPAEQSAVRLPFQPPILVNQVHLSQPFSHGWAVGRGEAHLYGGVALQYRSNVFYKTTRVDHASLELADVGLRFTLPAPDAARRFAADPEADLPPPWLVVDYGAQFQLFNRFHELNYIEQHGLLGAHLRNSDLGVDLTDRLGTRHEPETAEMAVLLTREIQTFYHDLELGAFAPAAAADAPAAGRLGAAITLNQRRHQGTGLNFAEYDAFGVNLAYEDERLTAPAGGDPLTFKLSIRGVSHPTRLLNNFVQYQLVVKSGGALVGSAVPGVLPWDVEFALGAAVIDVQTFRPFTGEKRRDALLPVVAVQIDGDLNSRQYLHFRLRVAHEPDQSFRANYLRRTTIAAQLLQRLNDAYRWEVRATQTWEDPSKGPTLSQFEVFAEVRWFKEFPRVYLGRHAPLYLRVETRQVETVERNVTGVKSFGDTRVTAGWAIGL